MSRRTSTGKKKGGNKLKLKKQPPSWQPTLKHYFGGKPVLVQPTISHFVKSATKSETVPNIKQENTDTVLNFPSNLFSPAGKKGDSSNVNVSAQEESKNGTVVEVIECQSKSKNELTCVRSVGTNPFSKCLSTRLSTSVPNDVIAKEGFPHKSKPEKGGQKPLSLKVRKRKHRTLNISPPQNMEDSKNCKKVCRTVEDENVQPDSIMCECHSTSEFKHTEKVEDRMTIKVCDTRKLSCKFSIEEKALLDGYAIDTDQSNARKPCLADLDTNECLSFIGSPAKNQTSKTRHLSVCKTNKLSSSTALSIPCSPSFSPRKTTPKAFSPYLERTGFSSLGDSVERDGHLLNDHTRMSEINEKLESSTVLFSTPDDGPAAIVSPCVLSKLMPRRTLVFDAMQEPAGLASTVCKVNETLLPSMVDTVPTGACRNDSISVENDFSFMNDISLSEFANVSLGKMEGGTSPFRPSKKQPHLNRHLVLEVTSQECSSEDALLCTGRRKSELLLRLLDQQTKAEKICYLRDDWLNLDVSPGDVVQVNADFDADKECFVVDNCHEESSVILYPDCLVSGTSVANSITCARKAVLADKFKGYSGESEAMVIGKMLHEVFQRVLLRRQDVGVALVGVDLREAIMKEIQSTVSTLDSLNQLYCLGMSEVAAKAILGEYVPAIMEWCETYMKKEPVTGSGEIEFKRPNDNCTTSSIAVTDILDIEENIWSPRFGLKGKVDVTLTMGERRGRGGERVLSHRVPLELKTGKMYRKQGTVEHRAQLTLYSVMLGDRYVTPPPGGLLFYLKGGHTQGLAALPHEKRGLLIARNHLARYHNNHHDHMTLPGMLREPFTCKHCSHLKQCTLYHKSIEQGTDSSSGIGELFSKVVDNIPKAHLDFFSKWYRLLSDEEQCCRMRDGPPFWLFTAAEREKDGTCLANMVAVTTEADTFSGKFVSLFSKSFNVAMATTVDTLFTVHDRVVVSHNDGSSWAVAIGTILSLTYSSSDDVEVRVLIDKTLPTDSTVLYRIDQAPGYSRGSVPSTLADFCVSDSERDQRLRELVIDLVPPRFKQLTHSLSQSLSSNLNSSQHYALLKVLSAQDYVLVLGMPGTGKTTTIACLVEVLVSQGKSVLLTSYTHSAVDNVLLKLKQNGVDFLRLGSLLRVHPTIQPYTPARTCDHLDTVQSVEEVYHSKPVVATTCLGVNHPIFMRRSFDVCIVDEASQITLPASLGPLRYASTFVLVGDHYQLPPLVQSQQARDGGLDVSLFRYLSEHHPNALVSLREQYRMNREIMSLSNTLIYNNRLVCGREEIALGRLHLSQFTPPLLTNAPDFGWIERAVDPGSPVVFLNTDRCSDAMETLIGDHICNEFEAQVVKVLVQTLIKCGLEAAEIGVITPLRQQQNLIREKLQDLSNSANEEEVHVREEAAQHRERGGGGGRRREGGGHVGRGGGAGSCVVEVNTVDKYQGRDKECVIVSCTRSNPKGNTGALLRDWRRINVALTRAKYKLILIGSCDTLGHAPLLKSLVDILSGNNWIVDIPTSTQFHTR